MSGWREAITLGVLATGLLAALVWGCSAVFVATSGVASDTERAQAGCAALGFLLMSVPLGVTLLLLLVTR